MLAPAAPATGGKGNAFPQKCPHAKPNCKRANIPSEQWTNSAVNVLCLPSCGPLPATRWMDGSTLLESRHDHFH